MTFLKCPECPASEEKRYDTTQLQDHLGNVHLDFVIYRCRFCPNGYVSHYRAMSHMKMKCRVPPDTDIQYYTEPLLLQNGQKLKEMNRLINVAVQNYAKEVTELGGEAAFAPSTDKTKAKKPKKKNGAKEKVDDWSVSQSAFDQSRNTDAVSSVREGSEAGHVEAATVVLVKKNPVKTQELAKDVVVSVGGGEVSHPVLISNNMEDKDDGDGNSLTIRPRSEASDLTVGVEDRTYYHPPSDVSSNPSDAIGEDFVSNVGDDVRLVERNLSTPEPTPSRQLLPARYYQSPLTPPNMKEEYSVEEMIHLLQTKFGHAERCSEYMSNGEAFPCGCDPQECSWIREVARLINEVPGFWDDVNKNHPKTTRLFKVAMGFSVV